MDARVDTSKIKVKELFSSAAAAKLLNRAPYCIWYHSTRNLHPIWVEKRLFLTKQMLRELIVNHLRLKKGETQEELLRRVEAATPSSYQSTED